MDKHPSSKTFYKIIFVATLCVCVMLLEIPLVHYFLHNTAWSWVFRVVDSLLIFLIIWILHSELLLPLGKLSIVSQEISQGNTGLHHQIYFNELAAISSHLALIDKNIENATMYAKEIGEGKFEFTDAMNDTSGLDRALSDMKEKLLHVSVEEKKRNWAIAGIASFGQLFRDNLEAELKDIAFKLISGLVKYIEANQGGIFIINDQDKEDLHIQLVACYAYERRKYTQARIEMNEGLIGQCVYEKEIIYINDVPDNYVKITSGLGDANPGSILLVPIKVNNHIFGVIEIASFHHLQRHQIDFVEQIAESFASTLSSVKSNRNTQQLLLESQKIASALQVKENELLQNEYDLRDAQEKLSNKLIELQAESNLTNCILEAINKSNACIEFDMNGNILNANEMFLSVMGYTKVELVGKNERILVPSDELESKRYDMLWDSIKQGNFNTGEFRRYSKAGKELWIDATYNPIMDLNNKPYKILMFALFTTEAKEKENDYKNKINALNETFAFVEINPDYTIRTVNQVFLDKFKYKRKDIKNLGFFDLLADQSDVDIKNVRYNIEQGESFKKTLSMHSSDGEPLKFFTSLTPSKDIEGRISNYYAIMMYMNGQMLSTQITN